MQRKLEKDKKADGCSKGHAKGSSEVHGKVLNLKGESEQGWQGGRQDGNPILEELAAFLGKGLLRDILGCILLWLFFHKVSMEFNMELIKNDI